MNTFNLPSRLARLSELAYNLWWTWNPSARELFEMLDRETWDHVNHNPVKFLHTVHSDLLGAAAKDAAYLARFDAALAAFDVYMHPPSTWFGGTHPELANQAIAYFSAEFGLHESLPIYSGGLGILSGDHVKEASDLGLPLVGIGFLYPQGYFTQRINADGWQEAIYEKLDFEFVPAVAARDRGGREVIIEVELHDRKVYAKVWRLQVGRTPLFLMDTDVEQNAPNDRELAARLYGGDHEMRIAQEIVLGIGGVRALRALGYEPRAWHLNEGHSAFSVLERARELVQSGMTFDQARQATQNSTLFTTHTPVPAGNDTFGYDLIERYFSNFVPQLGTSVQQLFDLARQDSALSMTVLALKFSGAANGVSQLHGEVARKMWHFLWSDRTEQDVPIGSVTNGVHTLSWLAPEFRSLFDEYFPADWVERIDDPVLWEIVEDIPDEKIWATQYALRHKLVDFVRQRAGSGTRVSSAPHLDPNALTLGFARRFATYKRAVLMFRDAERLKRILNNPDRPVQILFSGKAHPADDPGKYFIQQVVKRSREPGFSGRIVFVEDYDINVARHLVQGVDVWLNNPRRPFEASGTSGQKAALNGIPNFSVLDGWWREGFVRGVSGWAIGKDQPMEDSDAQDASDAESFYTTLENEIVPLFYVRGADAVPHAWIRMMKGAIKTIAPRFSTRRMVKEYVEKYYVPAVMR